MDKLQVNFLNEFSKIEKELEAIKETHNHETEKLKHEITTAKTNEQKAMEEVNALKEESDPHAYSAAIEKHKTLSNIVQFYDGKLEELQTKPLITNKQYAELTKRIKNVLDDKNNECREEAQELIGKLAEIEQEVVINIKKGNELLAELQHNLYKDDATRTIAKGNKIRLESLENRYKDYNLVHAISFVLNTAKANNIKK